MEFAKKASFRRYMALLSSLDNCGHHLLIESTLVVLDTASIDIV